MTEDESTRMLDTRLKNDVLAMADGPLDLMGSIPVEAEEIEALMNRRS